MQLTITSAIIVKYYYQIIATYVQIIDFVSQIVGNIIFLILRGLNWYYDFNV